MSEYPELRPLARGRRRGPLGARNEPERAEAEFRGVSWAALVIDWLVVHEHVVLVVPGVYESRRKRVLAFREGRRRTGPCAVRLAALVELIRGKTPLLL